MAGLFGGLITATQQGLDPAAAQRLQSQYGKIDPATLSQLVGQQARPQSYEGAGGYWVTPGFGRYGEGDASSEFLDPNATTFTKVLDPEKNIVGVYDRQGNLIEVGEQNPYDGGKGLLKAGALALAMYGGAQFLNGAFGGAGTVGGTGAGTITGGSGISIGGAGGGFGAGTGLGGTGAGLSITPGMTAAFTTPQLAAMGATGAGALTSAANSGGGFLDALKTGAGAVKDAVGAIPGLGGALATGAALGLAKDIKPAAPDSALKSSIDSLTGSANKANAAADADEQYFRDVFGPRYLAAMDEQIQTGRELTNFNMGLARKYDQRYWDTTARFEDQFYRDVDNFNDEDERRRRRNQAGATVEQETSAGLNQLVRGLDRRGLNPNSGVVLSQMRQGAQQGTLNKALAMNLAEEAARMEGLNLKATAAGMGRGLPGTAAGFAGQAAGTAGLGMSGIAGAQQGYNANRSTWNSTLGRGDNAIGQVGQWGASLTGAANTAKSQNAQGWNQIIGTGLGMFGPKFWGN